MFRVFGLSGHLARQTPWPSPSDRDLHTVGCRGAFDLWCRASKDMGFRAETFIGKEALPARWIEVWRRLRGWLNVNCPHVRQTLRPPAQDEHVQMLQRYVGATLDDGTSERPVAQAVASLWRVCDGQNTALQPEIARELDYGDGRNFEWFHGLFGGYTAYDHEVTTFLLPLVAAIKLTTFLRQRVAFLEKEHPTKVVFACAHRLAKMFLVDVYTGKVYACCRQLLEQAVPATLGTLAEGSRVRLEGLQARPELNDQIGTLRAFEEPKGRWQVKLDERSEVVLLKQENIKALVLEEQRWPSEAGDGFVRWFEEYVNRLETRVYQVSPLRPTSAPDTSGICLFPEEGPELSRCVTHGVEVTASCVYMPEHPQGWTYSIRLALVGTAEERGFETCQLTTRKWIIEEDGREPDIVQGDGVIGLFPILETGGWALNPDSDPHGQYMRDEGHIAGPFRYQSCSGRNASMRGFFSGELTFVPGSRRSPTGAPFEAKLACFRLRVPGFIY